MVLHFSSGHLLELCDLQTFQFFALFLGVVEGVKEGRKGWFKGKKEGRKHGWMKEGRKETWNNGSTSRKGSRGNCHGGEDISMHAGWSKGGSRGGSMGCVEKDRRKERK